MNMHATSHRRVPLAQFVVATGLVVLNVAVIAFWLLLVSLALNHALDPWSNAGILLYGLGFVALAAAPGIPGAVWSRQLAGRSTTRSAKLARLSGMIGLSVLAIGLVVAIGVLLWAVTVA